MKKMYIDPDFEIVNLRLIADVLNASDEFEHPEHGTEVGGDEEFGDDW